MIDLKQRIVRAFDGATDYDRLADLQQEVAASLAERIRRLDLCENPRILEIGCGTGFLAQAYGPLPTGWDWLMTDIAPAMLDRARRRFPADGGYRFALLDGEDPRLAEDEKPFDLICSSLAAQWFADLPAAFARLFALLAPGGRLVVSTLAEGTFAEWRAAHAAAGLEAGTPHYPSVETLEAIRLGGRSGRIEAEPFTTNYAHGRDFLRALRGIGAATPRPEHRPLSPRQMRAVLKAFEAAGATVRWNIAFCTFERPAKASA